MSTLSPCESPGSLLSLSQGLLKRHSPLFLDSLEHQKEAHLCRDGRGQCRFAWNIVLGEKKRVLGPISWGNTGANKVREASLLQDFSEPLIVNRDFGLLRRDPGVQHFPQGVLQDMWNILWATQV